MSLFRYVGKRIVDSYKREPNISTEEWASKNVYFSGTDVSPITGSFQIKYSPHLKTLFALVDKPQVHKIFAKWASQSAKSLFELIVAGKRLDTEPTNILYMQPIKDDIPKIVDVKIDPLLKCMKSLWRKFEDYRVKESIRSKRDMKRLAGGSLIISGSSVKERKSLTIPFLLMDEIAEFEQGAVVEAEERTKSFSKFFPKVVGVSTIVHPEDEICTNFNDCEVKLEFHYICPKCNDNFYPNFDLFIYPSKAEYASANNITTEEIIRKDRLDDAKQKVHVRCPHCEHKINSRQKDEMILDGQMDWFIAHEDGTYERFYMENITTETSFGADMNSLGSYFVQYEILADNLIKAEDDDIKLEKIYRGWFNKFYARNVVTTTENDMLLLGNGLKRWKVPLGTYKIYMGVDTQKDHFWYEIKAYCFGKKSHSIASGRIETFAELEDIWVEGQHLDDENGDVHMISKMGIDRRGYNQDGVRRTDEVDAFVSYMVQKYKNGDENRVYATEGHPTITGDKAYQIRTQKDESNNRTKLEIKIIKLSNTYLKNSVQRSIERAIMKANAETEEDDGFLYEANLFYINQDTLDADAKGTTRISYIRQLTAEVYDYYKNPKTGKLDKAKSWINPKGADNHLFDTSVICEGFAEIDMVSLERKIESAGVADALSSLSSL